MMTAEDDSPITAVIGQETYVMGEMAVDYLARAFAGEENIPKIAFAPFVFVTNMCNLRKVYANCERVSIHCKE